MADDLSLLFRLRAENSQAKSTIAETQAAVASLRNTFGSDMNQMQVASSKALGQIQNQLNNVVSRIPGGNAFISITDGLKGVAAQSERVSPALRTFNRTVDDLSKTTGKSSTEMVRFLGEFVKLPNATERAALGYAKFGSKFDELRPKLEQAGTDLAKVADEAVAMGGSLATAAPQIALLIIAFAAAATGAGLLGKALFDLAKQSADVEGKMFDLSQQTGIAVETLSALEVLAKTTGGDIGNLTQSLVAFQRNLESAQDPTSKQAELFRKLGVEANNTEDALRKTLAALARLPEGFNQTNQAAELFGARGGKQVLAILKESKGDLDGAIARFRELGILISETDAKAADEFNDQLALLQFQLRATGAVIGREVIPPALAALRELSRAIRDNRDLINALATVAGFLARVFGSLLSIEIKKVSAAWEVAKSTLLAIQAAYEAIAIAAQIIARFPILPSTKGVTPTTDTSRVVKTAQDALEAGNESRARQRLQGQLQAQRELLAAQNAFFDQEKSLAADRLAQAEREFQLGQATRKDKLQATLENNRAIRDADLAQIANKRALLLTEAALASDDFKKRTELESQINILDLKAEERKAQSEREQADARAAAQKQARDDEIAHRESLLELAAKFDAARIAQIEASVEAGTRTALDGDAAIANIENAALDREQAFLVKKLAIAGVEPAERQKIVLEIAKIDADRTALAQQQEDRRIEIVRRGLETQRQILTGSIDSLLQVERIRGNAIIATIQSLAALRVKTEEDAAKEITAIRLGLIDSEIEATRGRLQAATGIVDPQERAKALAELNNRLEVLEAERSAIQTQGNRDREDGRQQDLENERRYADELIRTKERIRNIERDAAREVIELMIIHHARRRDIIRARLEFDKKDEEQRHRQELESIERQERENRESNRTQEEKDEREAELNRLREAEAERHRLAMKGIKDQAKQDEKESDPLGRIDLDVENLKEFASVIEDSIVPLGEILTSTFLQVADAIGQTVANWVLLGETGPAVMRKILAQALASIAAEAAVNAIKELALGFAMLFLNPADSAAHFTAAALWGSIAGVAAVAGRGVAGDLFKPKNASESSSSRSNEPNQLNPLNLERNTVQPQRVSINVNVTQDKHSIVDVWAEDYQSGGKTRELTLNDGVFGG